MKKSIIYPVIAAFVLLAAGCAKDPAGTAVPEGITLTLRTTGTPEVSVKAGERNGEDAHNENLLNSIFWFFYPEGAATDRAASISGFKTGLSETGTYSTVIPVSTNTIINDLFKDGNTCHLFAVANPPADLVGMLEGAPSLSDLREAVVLSALDEGTQDNFVMTYDGTVDCATLSGKTAIDADVELLRLASKITIGAVVSESIVDDSTPGHTYTYTPVSVSAAYVNGINRTLLGGFDKSVVEDSDYFKSDEVPLSENGEDTIDAKKFILYRSGTPVYTYPSEWEFTSPTEPYILYRVDWKVVEEGVEGFSTKPLYYKLNLGEREIGSNMWYNISGKLSVLGSIYPDEPTQVYYFMNYQVAGWNSAFSSEDDPNTPAIIKDTRYLSVNQKEWTLNNKESVSIPYSSSHECIVANAKMIKESYSTGTSVKTTTALNPSDATHVRFNLAENGLVTVSHALNNTLEAGMDITPTVIEFDLQHADNSDFSEHVTIEQRPAIFLSSEANSGGRSSANDYGYTYVNGVQTSNTWQAVLGANSSGNNSSIYLTVITVSQFDPSTGFIVGDPREPAVDNLDTDTSSPGVQWNHNNPKSTSAKYNGETRTIMYYHPTVDDGTRDNVVAPSIRVNSANCRSARNETYLDAKQRCAAYQEDGYPAGRWRLPTLAECQLIQTMSSNGMVPTIFIQNNSSYYCYAGGWFRGNASSAEDYHPYSAGYSKTTDTGGSGGGAARCVYDEWYWSEVDKKMGWDNTPKAFTWGDVPDDFYISE